jgi:hypothetical protein
VGGWRARNPMVRAENVYVSRRALSSTPSMAMSAHRFLTTIKKKLFLH